MKITAYNQIFNQKLESIKKRLKRLLNMPKKDRDKKQIKSLIKEAKSLKKIVSTHEKEKKKITCPVCSHKFIA